MPGLRRRGRVDEREGHEPPVPWDLPALLRNGPAELDRRAVASDGETFAVALVLGAGHAAPADAGLPGQLLAALEAQGTSVGVVPADAPGGAAAADVVLAAGWRAAPAVLMLPGARARAVLATAEPPAFPGTGWTTDIAVLGPPWLGGELPIGTDEAYQPLPTHRRDDLLLVHGDDPFGMLVAAELQARRPDLDLAVSGVPLPVALPFPAIGVQRGSEATAHGFSSATVGLAPPVRGWRPAALAMQACGLAVVAPDDPAARAALGDTASFADDPLTGADAVEQLLDDFPLRAERSLAGVTRTGGWDVVATELAATLRAL